MELTWKHHQHWPMPAYKDANMISERTAQEEWSRGREGRSKLYEYKYLLEQNHNTPTLQKNARNTLCTTLLISDWPMPKHPISLQNTHKIGE